MKNETSRLASYLPAWLEDISLPAAVNDFLPEKLVPLVLAAVLILAMDLKAEAGANTMPRLSTVAGRHALIVDGTPFLILGAQCNNSSAWSALLPKVWPAIDHLHANTLERRSIGNNLNRIQENLIPRWWMS